MTTGRVYIVGAGPGDPDLLTLKAARLLSEADVVVYDRLVSDPILSLIPPGTTRIFAGKMARRHHMPQQEINGLLVALARGGKTVVRLKGGDPYLFGRGGEEALHLAASGVPFTVVPGVTSASGCTASAGIPLTHRDMAHGVHYVAGHTKNEEPLSLDWQRLADPETTLVVYMGRTNVLDISTGLMAHGLAGETPAAAIINGTRSDQRVLHATLATLPDVMTPIPAAAATLIIIGRVVGLARTIAPLAAPDGDRQREPCLAAPLR
jgi:uroporphyrin-III C-methyltransferase/precorrin-2 dehydrogenase/sirohydrochlorin ferrochelatase/uroporphyrin-III C-methyltransferase